jgi:hypothetical protein
MQAKLLTSSSVLRPLAESAALGEVNGANWGSMHQSRATYGPGTVLDSEHVGEIRGFSAPVVLLLSARRTRGYSVPTWRAP